MKKVLGLLCCLLLVVAFSGAGLAGSEMGAKMEGNLSGEIVKIDKEMVDIKDSAGKVHSVHVDPKGTKKTGELKVGAKVGANVTDSGHANSIWVEEEKK
jgi:hypothetical protein